MTENDTEITREKVLNVLQEVLDPCSCHSDAPINIIELGLVETIKITNREIYIELLPTTPMCMYMGNIIHDVKIRVSKIPNVENVAVEQTIGIWTPDRMDPELREQRQKNFNRRIGNEEITPHAESSSRN